MNFWEQFAIIQAQAALSVLIRRYAGKYFTTTELAAADLILSALADLPQRIHSGPIPGSLSEVGSIPMGGLSGNPMSQQSQRGY